MSAPDPIVTPAWVTGPALAALGPDGRFTIDTGVPQLMSRARADSFAIATVRFLREVYGDSSSADLLAGRGGPVHLKELRPCLRRVYTATALDYSSLPGGASRERFAASNWLVTTCDASGTPEFVVAVADVRTSLEVANNDFVVPWGTSGELLWFPLPIAYAQHGLFLSPEAAVELVVRASGARVREIPTANLSWLPLGTSFGADVPQCVMWKVTTDAVIPIRTSAGRSVATDEFFVRREAPCGRGAIAAFVPSPTQPSALWKRVFATSVETVLSDSALIPTRAPVNFERVTEWKVP